MSLIQHFKIISSIDMFPMNAIAPPGMEIYGRPNALELIFGLFIGLYVNSSPGDMSTIATTSLP
jgi:hypothetical protein